MVNTAIFDVPAWHVADPTLMLAKLKKETPRLPVALWTIDFDIAPVDLYTYLRARFGPPNGFQMTLKSPTSDNLIHWHWSLQYLDRVIEFSGLTMSAQLIAEGTGDPSAEDVRTLVRALKADFSNHGAAMSSERKRLESWNIFINPYCRLKRVIDRFRERLAELDIRHVELPSMPHTEEEMSSFPARMEACTTIYNEVVGISTSLRMFAPVLAESFINLVIFLLVDPRTREDRRLYDSIFRQDIDVRVRGLHLSCSGFVRAVDVTDNRFKAFQALMQHRNDFLHGNIAPDRLSYREVYFDGNIPLPKKYENMAELALVNSLKHVEPEAALAEVEAVNNFMTLVFEALPDQIIANVQLFMETLDPGWRADTKRAGVLFPPHHAFMFLDPRAPDRVRSTDQ
jgi:hypothetical protein